LKNKTLEVWIKKEGLKIDKDTSFRVDKSTLCTIKNLDRIYETLKIEVKRVVSVGEYQKGFIGKYENELKEWTLRFLQQYALVNNLKIVINKSEIQSNEADLYEEFRASCKKQGIKTLLKPSGGSATFVYKELKSSNVLFSSNLSSKIDDYVVAAIDWYNTGQTQRQPVNQFLHYFIPLEILTARFIKKSGSNWKSKYPEKFKEIKKVLKNLLQAGYPHKFSGLIQLLSEFSFPGKVKKYFESIFSKKEIVNFWQDDSDITFNAKWHWKQFRLMSQYKQNKERVDLFNILAGLYDKRNRIIHKGLQEISSKDILITENILRRVLKKEIKGRKP